MTLSPTTGVLTLSIEACDWTSRATTLPASDFPAVEDIKAQQTLRVDQQMLSVSSSNAAKLDGSMSRVESKAAKLDCRRASRLCKPRPKVSPKLGRNLSEPDSPARVGCTFVDRHPLNWESHVSGTVR